MAGITEKLEQELREELQKCGMMFRLFSRVKTEASIRRKLGKKGDAYRQKGKKLQDLIGFRVVLYFPDDVETLAFHYSSRGVVKRAVDEPDTFTFCPQRLNLTRRLPEAFVEDFRRGLSPDVEPFVDHTYEIQLRTVFSEGWHEVEHDLRYKCKEDWKGCDAHSRTLNGVIASLETAEWTMRALFHDLAAKNCREGNYRAMMRNKMRLRFLDSDFSSEVASFLDLHREVAEAVMNTDRMVVVLTLLNHREALPLTFDNLLFLINRIEIGSEELQALEGEETRAVLERFLYS